MPPPQPYPEWNDWAAYQFDQAVLFVGLTIENALHERVPMGGKSYETRPKYSLPQILSAGFRLPPPATARNGATFEDFVEELKALTAMPGSRGRVWTYVGPEPGQVQ